jgi:hypothetical protein
MNISVTNVNVLSLAAGHAAYPPNHHRKDEKANSDTNTQADDVKPVKFHDLFLSPFKGQTIKSERFL